MYDSLKLSWSPNPSSAEKAYRAAGLVKTKGTIYLLPPDDATLRESFNAPRRPQSRLSSGAKALCKHFERGGASSEHGIAHPFWTLPTGSNDNKTATASAILDQMLLPTSDGAVWRNVMILHSFVAVYEIRNRLGYGMRWTLQLDRIQQRSEQTDRPVEIKKNEDEKEGWFIKSVAFRGFVEPIEDIDVGVGDGEDSS
ncbi:hypothetical protein DV736_g630, partial [Chaetothyriales sp. CBS 134916]